MIEKAFVDDHELYYRLRIADKKQWDLQKALSVEFEEVAIWSAFYQHEAKLENDYLETIRNSE